MGSVLKNLDWSMLTGILKTVIPVLICITFHELSHGFIAYRLGDNTAKEQGRLTLNPIKHIDIFGLLMLVVFKFGWAKPVMINMMNFKKPKRDMAVTALAGPVSNLLLASVFLFIYGIAYMLLDGDESGGIREIILEMIYLTAYISTALAVFNLIPIPPLDGSKVLFSFLPYGLYLKIMRYERFGVLILIAIIWTKVFDETIGNLTLTLFELMFKIAIFSYGLVT